MGAIGHKSWMRMVRQWTWNRPSMSHMDGQTRPLYIYIYIYMLSNGIL
jgi:hypothetical protein